MGSRCSMKHILSWNCRGLGSPKAVNALRRIVINENPLVIFLQETKMHAHEMEKIKVKLKYSSMVAVGCIRDGRRRSGGLALLWTKEWDVIVQSYST